jgi:hypothetical protein
MWLRLSDVGSTDITNANMMHKYLTRTVIDIITYHARVVCYLVIFYKQHKGLQQIKNFQWTRLWWLPPLIPATWKTEMRRMAVPGQLGQKSLGDFISIAKSQR